MFSYVFEVADYGKNSCLAPKLVEVAIFGYFWTFSMVFGYINLLFTVNSTITNLLTKNYAMKITDHEDNKQLFINLVDTLHGDKPWIHRALIISSITLYSINYLI